MHTMSVFNTHTLKEKMESFWPKCWVAGGTKIWPGIPSNNNIGNYLSQIDSVLIVKLAQSNWKFDSQNRVDLTQIFYNFSSASDSTF